MIDTRQIREMIQAMGPGEHQKALLDILDSIEAIEVTGTSGGDMVVVTVSGTRRVKRIRISDEAVGSREMLEDLIASATNNALERAEQAAQEKLMSALPATLLSGLGGTPFRPG